VHLLQIPKARDISVNVAPFRETLVDRIRRDGWHVGKIQCYAARQV
jgi:hypothetical protein